MFRGKTNKNVKFKYCANEWVKLRKTRLVYPMNSSAQVLIKPCCTTSFSLQRMGLNVPNVIMFSNVKVQCFRKRCHLIIDPKLVKSRIQRRGIDPTCWGFHYSTETPSYGNPTYSEKSSKNLKRCFLDDFLLKGVLLGLSKKGVSENHLPHEELLMSAQAAVVVFFIGWEVWPWKIYPPPLKKKT